MPLHIGRSVEAFLVRVRSLTKKARDIKRRRVIDRTSTTWRRALIAIIADMASTPRSDVAESKMVTEGKLIQVGHRLVGCQQCVPVVGG